jgi:hypothetical protein
MSNTKCKNCGAAVPVKTKFCAACGTEADHTASLETSSTDKANELKAMALNFNYKKFIKPAIAVVAVLIVAIVAINIFSPDKYEQVKGTVYITQSHDSVIIIPNGRSRVEIEGHLISNMRSLDERIAAALINEEYDRFNTDGSALYLITDRPQFISNGVYLFWLAASGNAVAYVKERDTAAGTAELWLFSGGKNTRISRDFSLFNSNNFAISPDGKAVAFVTTDGDRHTGVVWNGRLHELGRDITPVAISNKARFIYYFRNDAFFVQKGTSGDNRERLGDASDVSTIHANKDLSQIVFTSNARSFISRKGGSRESLSGNVSYFITPNGTPMQFNTNILFYGISSFANTFYLNRDDSIVYIDRKFETNNVVRNVNFINLARDGKTLTYLSRMSIYKVNGTNANAEPQTIVERGVTSLIATADGKAVFFVNDIDELFYQRGTGRPVMVSNYFTNSGRALNIALFQGDTLFFINDDELFSSSGNRARAISGINGSVQGVSAGQFAVFVTSNDDGDTLHYRSTDGNRFELMRQE